jgi:hypothetical protein
MIPTTLADSANKAWDKKGVNVKVKLLTRALLTEWRKAARLDDEPEEGWPAVVASLIDACLAADQRCKSTARMLRKTEQEMAVLQGCVSEVPPHVIAKMDLAISHIESNRKVRATCRPSISNGTRPTGKSPTGSGPSPFGTPN